MKPSSLQMIDSVSLASVTGGGALFNAGHAVGFGAGVAVTAALGTVPSWSTQVPGAPAGFERRHESVIGPKVERYAAGLSAGPWKELASGVGAGATQAPGWSFRHGL